MNRITKYCEICGVVFSPQDTRQVLCVGCRANHGKKYGPCKECGIIFKKNSPTHVICPDCFSKRPGVIVIWKKCIRCGREFNATPTNMVQCRRCRESHTLARRRYSNTVQYRWMRDEILKRMGNKCAMCNGRIERTQDFQLHHIEPVSLGGPDSPENITLVCLKCHREIHSCGWKKKSQGAKVDTLADVLAC